jgi:putative ABC transport system permease protein
MPDWSSLVRTRLVALRLDPAREREIVEELSQHLDQRYDELRNDGRSEADARRIAADELLDPDALARHMRPLRQANVPPPIAPGAPRRHLAGDLWQDLRYAARLLRRQPGFAAAAVQTLALGLGANTAIFALVDATLLRPLPFPAPGDLVMLREHTETSAPGPVSPVNLRDWRDRSRTLSGVAGFVPNVGGMVMTGADGSAETVPRQWVTAGFFDVLGVRPKAGRFFTTTDDVQISGPVTITESPQFRPIRSMLRSAAMSLSGTVGCST